MAEDRSPIGDPFLRPSFASAVGRASKTFVFI